MTMALLAFARQPEDWWHTQRQPHGLVQGIFVGT
jgi:hypothetical protein